MKTKQNNRIKIGLRAALLAVLLGFLGGANQSYGGGVEVVVPMPAIRVGGPILPVPGIAVGVPMVPVPDIDVGFGAPDMYLFGGGYYGRRDARDYGRRGADSRGRAHRGGRR